MRRSRRASPALIGAFVLGAIALAASVVVVWGSGRLFRHTITFVCYFRGSVNGLNLGAPVKFRGVQIGTVTQIRSRIAQGAAVTPEELRIPVWFEVDPKQVSDIGGAVTLDRPRVDELVAQGLRGQLQLESIVTGVLYLGLDFFPGSPAVLAYPNPPDVFEIPTVPTSIERASQAITKFLAQIEKVDLDAAVRAITGAADGVNALVRSPEVERVVVAARDTLGSIRQLSDAAQPHVRPLMGSVEATSTRARESLQHLDAALTDVRTLIDTDGPLSVELTRTLVDVGDAARAVKDLAAYLERNPNALLVGRPAR